MNIERIKEKTEKVRGKIGVLFEDLTTGEGFTVLKGQDEDVFESASVIKLWIMSCAYEMAEQGRLDLDSTVILREEDMVPGPGVPDYHSDDAEPCIWKYRHKSKHHRSFGLMLMPLMLATNPRLLQQCHL